MLFAGREPDHVTRADFLDRPALALCPATAGEDNQSLPEWMRVPGGAGARLEGDAGAASTRWFRWLEQGSMRTAPVK
jgi:hypothetical protein